MRVTAFVVAMFAGLLLSAQEKEFEGIIKYRHSFKFDSSVTDTARIIEMAGTASAFYYKKGSYKWVYRSSVHEVTEYFDANKQTLYFQYSWSGDTVFKTNALVEDLLSFKQFDTRDTICGFACRKAQTKTFMKKLASLTERTIYYAPDIAIPSNRFYGYKLYATDFVTKKTKSWPLRIIIKAGKIPYVETYEATDVIPQELSDSEVYLPPGKPIKPLTLF
ncbi:MAG: hypothetical protein JST09_20160 [Bacteroidetes bacterium]|nr:hypothetical protein [Bacteroidota bacterium]